MDLEKALTDKKLVLEPLRISNIVLLQDEWYGFGSKGLEKIILQLSLSNLVHKKHELDGVWLVNKPLAES